MATPPLPDTERQRRKDQIESLVDQGYAPPGVRDGRASAAEAAKRLDGVNYPRWISDEERHRKKGNRHFLPNFIGVDEREEITLTASGEEAASAQDHAAVRARTLAGEVRALVTRSRYPLTNPDAIVIDSYVSQRYSAKSGSYRLVEGTPRTWLRDTLRVAPIQNPKGRSFLFTAAQNDTPIHEGFWQNLKAYADHIGAEIVVGPWTMCTSWWDETNPTARAYAEEIAPHLCFGQMAIGDNFVFCGEMNTLATANQPIGDLVTYSRNRWAVFPHAKRQLRSVPSTDPEIQAHQVMTTGSCTLPKVLPRKAGIKSLFHQVIGAVLVEFDEDGDLFCRQITASSDGAFYDLDRHVSAGRVSEGHAIEALICGDIHLRKLNALNALATFGFAMNSDLKRIDSMVDTLRPRHVVLHDVLDFEARNHHHVGDSGYHFEMAVRGRDSVLSEIVQVGEFLDQVTRPGQETIVVESNHDLALQRYVSEGRYRCDGVNVRLGLQLEDRLMAHRQKAGDALDRGKSPESFSLFEHAVTITGAKLENVSWVHDGKSRLIGDIEIGHHGFRGANGAKGTVQGFARMGRKLSIGDKHAAAIEEGVCVAGSLTLRMAYAKGPSSWTVSNIIHYPDGHRSIVTMQNHKWRAKRPLYRVQSRSF